MDIALLRNPATRLPLVGSLLQPAGAPAPEAHLHFDRAARVWRAHDEREPRPAPVPLRECA